MNLAGFFIHTEHICQGADGYSGGGQVVSVLAFYSNDPSSNPAEVYNFSVKLLLKRTKINKKRGRGWPIFIKYLSNSSTKCICII